MDREKHEIRQLKRDIKRAGVTGLARLELQADLADDPEQAHEAQFDPSVDGPFAPDERAGSRKNSLRI